VCDCVCATVPRRAPDEIISSSLGDRVPIASYITSISSHTMMRLRSFISTFLLCVFFSSIARAQLRPASSSSSSSSTVASSRPANVVISRIDVDGQQITLQNIGGSTANITGWTLTDSTMRQPRVFTDKGLCDTHLLVPLEKLKLTKGEKCGFDFTVSSTVRLFDADEVLKGRVSWSPSVVMPYAGYEIRLFPDGKYRKIRNEGTILEVMKSTGLFSIFLEALDRTQIAANLTVAEDPDYDMNRILTSLSSGQEVIIPNFPWWYSPSTDVLAMLAVQEEDETSVDKMTTENDATVTTLSEPGIPERGPFTIFAPTDEAMRDMLDIMGGRAGPLPLEQFFKLPSLKEILLYHVVPGRFNLTTILRLLEKPLTQVNSYLGLQTAALPDVVLDGTSVSGRLLITDNCVDLPTPDEFTCDEQAKFGKCTDPFMTAPAQGWQGGYCQRSCGRCETAGSGARVVLTDLEADNGVIHGISRILFPPPIFETTNKEPAGNDSMQSIRRSQGNATRESDADLSSFLEEKVRVNTEDT